MHFRAQNRLLTPLVQTRGTFCLLCTILIEDANFVVRSLLPSRGKGWRIA